MTIKEPTVKYLDPKNDLTFRKIFGERPHLIKSFLNSILPLNDGQLIEKVEYLEPELIPELPNLKRSIVDVHCTDNYGRYFIVEMQMYWTSAFKQRMLFNTGKAYVRQLKSGGKFRELKPVYGLSLVDDIFHTSDELKDTYYHHYRMVHAQQTNEHIDGLELIFVELPKFKAQNFTDKKIQTLWLRFLTEIDENTEKTPEDLLENKEIKEALECVSQAAFSEEELLYYDQYWDAIRVEKAAIEELKKRNQELNEENVVIQQKLMEAQKREIEAQKREVEALKEKAEAEQKLIDLVKFLKSLNVPLEQIIEKTGLSAEKIERL
jgi:predicted transposase/invertase (TIGR01784 family)